MASEITEYGKAVEAIKTAILQAQYAAAKSTNAQQLRLYYAVGGYLARLSEKQKWGSGALDAIGEQLQKELPGLRGFFPVGISVLCVRSIWSGATNSAGGLIWNLQVPN